jgi:hypothetical protein
MTTPADTTGFNTGRQTQAALDQQTADAPRTSERLDV